MIPFPHQIAGAKFLADREFAILADAPRVGKTGTSIMAADVVLAESILVITTASGRAVWRKGFSDWSAFDRPVQIVTAKDTLALGTQVAITGWPNVADPKLHHQLLARRWSVIILDEHHYAKSMDAKRTRAVFGDLDASGSYAATHAIAGAGDRLWGLSGTPMPNSPLDLFPIMRFGAADQIAPYLTEESFLNQFCVWRPKKIGRGPYARTVRVIMEGKNLGDLRARIGGLMLRRTQQDVGITEPIYDTLPLIVPERARKQAESAADLAAVLAAIDEGNTRQLEMHLGPLRRLTGVLKARALVDLVKEELENGLDKIVLAFWHREVAEILIEGLAKYGVTGIDGSTAPKARTENVAAFTAPDGPRVFLGQIQAAGEAIDLSAAAEMIFVEMSSVPKDGSQMALRITNHNQKQRPRVRVASIAGSIDEPIQNALLRKIKTINEVIK
jgi:SNF2 family DNA or RNA helicase